MRGLHLLRISVFVANWIIPARAGFTNRRYAPLGELRGSSPRVRGLPCTIGKLLVRRGIIPARAGFTLGAGCVPPPGLDHPRACGVYSIDALEAVARMGSSPRVRGLRTAILVIASVAGIIPARAGFTRREADHELQPGDHPRACGVYSVHSRIRDRL